MALEERVGFLSGLRKQIVGSALGLAVAGAGLLYSGKAMAQDWPAPMNLGSVVNTVGSQINPERNGDLLFYDEQISNGRMKLYMADINTVTGEAENQRPYDLGISDPANTNRFESHVTESSDRLRAVWSQWARIVSIDRSQLMYGERSSAVDPIDAGSVRVILDDGSETQELSPTLTGDGSTLYYIKRCDIEALRECDPANDGVYRSQWPFDTNVRIYDFDDLIDVDGIGPNGRIMSIGVSDNDLSAIVAYTCDPSVDPTNCPNPNINDFDNRNDSTELAYFTRPNDRAPFVRTDAPSLVNVNTTASENTASLYTDTAARTISIYFSSDYPWPNAQGNNDLYVTTIDLPPCTSPTPNEVTGLRVERDRTMGDLTISFDTVTVPDAKVNLYIGQRSLIPSFAQFANSPMCGIMPIPYGGRSALFYTPDATRPLELFYVSASTCMGESPIGSSSTGVPYLPPDSCGPL